VNIIFFYNAVIEDSPMPKLDIEGQLYNESWKFTYILESILWLTICVY